MAGNQENGGVSSVKEQIRAVRADIDRHQRNIDELYNKQGWNWPLLFSAIGALVLLLGGLWTLTITPIAGSISDLKTWELKTTDRVTATEHTNVGQSEKLVALEKRVDILRELIRQVENSRLDRGEYGRDVTSNQKDLLQLNKRLDDLNAKLDQVFPPTKVLDDLLKRLSTLEQRTAPPLPLVAPAPPAR